MSETATLYELLARHLTGRRVTVERRAIPSIGTVGAAFLADDGEPVIMVDPDPPGLDPFWVYLHECAHVRLHFADLVKSNMHTRPPDVVSDNTTIERDPVYVYQETEADALANTWLDYARRHARPIAGYDMGELGLMLALLSWQGS